MADYPTLFELRELFGATAPQLVDGPVTGVSTDSRSLRAGMLFVALRGERFDGHAFVADALGRGAVAAVVDRRWRASDELAGQPLLRVDSPLQAYHALARWRRQRFAGPVVAVTGSVGKTTTKEIIRAALATVGPVLYTPANYNNEVGVPQSLLGLGPEHRFAVIEMGMRGPGQIRELGAVALPNVAAITNVGTAHIGLLGSREAIARAKCELLETLEPGGLAIVNADQPLLVQTAAAVWQGRTVGFGLERGELRGELVSDGRLQVEGQRFELPLPGRHHAMNMLCALAVARELGVPWEGLRALEVELPPGRGRRLQLDRGIVLLDETYNAGAESMRAALELLAREPAERRIAVLGTMKELGEHSVALHREVGQTVAALGLDALLILADPAEADALAQGAAGVAHQRFDGPEPLTDHLRATLRPGDAVLLKASRAVALDRVVAALVSS